MTTKLDKKMIENITGYQDKIVTLNFPDDIIQNIGVYIGSRGNKGFLTIIREVFQNSFDELMRATRGKSPCSIITVYYDETTHVTTIEDNGRGVPFTKMIDIYSNLNTSSNYTKELFDYSSGIHGQGAKATNAISDWFTAESYILGEAMKVEFKHGKTKGLEKIKNNNKQGTKVSFHPDYNILGELSVTCEDILKMMKSLVFLGKKGKIVDFHGVTKSGQKINTSIVNEDGILLEIFNRTQSPLIAPISLFHDDGQNRVDLAFTWDVENMSGGEDIISYANYSYTRDGGMHLEGFKDGVCKFFCDYMNKIYLGSGSSIKKKKKSTSNKQPLKVIPVDVLCGMRGIIATCSLRPIFGGQAKETISNEELKPFVKDVVMNGLSEWSKAKPSDLNNVCSYLKDVALKRIRDNNENIKITAKYKTDSLSAGLPSKYLRPTGTKDLEFIIVEGDSALGSARNTRCKARQGILPIRGKLPNIFKMTSNNKKKFLEENEEITGIINIISGGTGKFGPDFMPSDTKYEKIIIMSDGDQDGDHIATLILKLMLVLYPRLVEAGMVYRAIAPLYGIPSKRNKDVIERYFTTRADYTNWLYSNFSKSNEILKPDKSKLSNIEARDIIKNNSDYTYDMTVFSNRYAINIELLEKVGFSIIEAERSKSDLYKVISKNFGKDKKCRFLSITKEKGVVIIKGEYNELIQSIILTDGFMTDFNVLLNQMRENPYWYFILNGNHASLYDLLAAFEKSAPAHIIRFKGLGQMKPKQLQLTTLHPDMDRTLIRYNFQSASAALVEMRALESNRIKLLDGRKNTREDLIG